MGSEQQPGPNVVMLRARVLWLAAKCRFLQGADYARFTTAQLATMLDLPEGDGFSQGIEAISASLPADSNAEFDDAGSITIHNPDVAAGKNKAAEVMEYWLTSTGRGKRSITARRQSFINARVRDGWTVEQLCSAVDACLRSDWHTGDNPGGTVFTDCSHIFTVERLEKWLSSQPKQDSRDEAVETALAATLKRRRRVIP